MREVYDFLKQSGVYYLATVEGNKPRVRPFGTIDIFEDKLYIQTGRSKDVAKQMELNPHIEISAMVGADKWIRISAEAVYDERIEPQEHMLDAYPNLKAMYQPGDGNTAVYYLKNVTATFCSFTDAPRTVTF